VGLATAASLECYYIYLAILDPMLTMLSIVVLGICSVQSTHMSWRVCRLGVGAVYELPKNVCRVGEADCVHWRSADDVRIPSGYGSWEARSYIRLALGR
jgi:hypothetical protein